ncbi:MAG: bifunctional diaminohydroxyphosphoribosylaminopyrimidine deaminase/5-amino-6-(5-phosphoribosylamino)uracil reductase RibD [Actinobacteria bacterium]|nr:bifunctional diaminohydroxyphosphoribosylaminopyrimidine deaminase/5-amino-6-(5-phosphoribosylamino)uracil reductase RibD [Actinomycetota bacterium]
MRAAVAAAASVRHSTSPNPWVGAVVVADGSVVGTGATSPPGGPHAEIHALAEAGDAARGATLYVTLEPCDHRGRTGPCTEAILGAGIVRAVVGVADPDPEVVGRGLARLREGGVEVVEGIAAADVAEQLAAYLHQRRTGRPYVVLKLASTLDGRIAAPDGSSTWITGPEARADAHRLRAESDAVCVGAGTVRSDDPALTIRDWSPPGGGPAEDPRRIVLGPVPEGARVQPAESHEGPLEDLLGRLGGEGVLQLLVEGGADVAGRFHRAGLVDRYVVYVAPALLGGDDGRPLLAGPGAPTMVELRRGRFASVVALGDDLRLDLVLEGS